MGTTVTVSSLPNCDVCSQAGRQVPAEFDAKTKFGPWAYLCRKHFQAVGPGRLGTGYGQRLRTNESHDGTH